MNARCRARADVEVKARAKLSRNEHPSRRDLCKVKLNDELGCSPDIRIRVFHVGACFIRHLQPYVCPSLSFF
jgi:hypothetical protein